MSVRLAVFIVVVSLLASPETARATEWFVAPGGSGKGTSAAPFGKIQDAINVAQPGDVVTVAPGTYAESIRSVRNGTSAQRITLRARDGRGSVTVTVNGRVLNVSHAYFTVDGLILDGQYGASDLVRVETPGSGFTLRRSEVRRTSRDAIDMGAPQDVLIEDSLIHHALNAAAGRTDAHGIVAGAVRRLTIRNTEVHTFSGDAFQVDPGRSTAGWNDVLIEGCRFWLAPLPKPENGFPAGTVTGENAVDTKVAGTAPRAKLTIRNTDAWGFQNGLISNMAAFNLKENVDALLDRVTVYQSEIAFRMRGPGPNGGALVRVQNAVVHSSATAFRYEDNIDTPKLYNVTIGGGVSRPFVNAAASGTTLDVRNLLLLGSSLPAQAAGSSNKAVPASSFVGASAHNYALAQGSAAVDAGVAVPGVTEDRQGTKRPQGATFDIGAYERTGSTTPGGGDGGGGDDAEVVLHAWTASMLAGNWSLVNDASAAGGARVTSVNQGVDVKASQAANPADYFELQFNAEKGKPYRLWVRGKAEGNRSANDSVFVQFSGSIDAVGRAVYRIGTPSVISVALKDCGKCSLSSWGWQDNATGVNALGPVIYFGSTGRHTIRIQIREDGLSIDQIVLSPAAYLTNAPGATVNDTTILNPSNY
jgi:hypothetical protein